MRACPGPQLRLELLRCHGLEDRERACRVRIHPLPGQSERRAFGGRVDSVRDVLDDRGWILHSLSPAETLSVRESALIASRG